MATIALGSQNVRADGTNIVTQGIGRYADGSSQGLDSTELVAMFPVVAATAVAAHRAAITAADADPFVTPGSNFTSITVLPHQKTITALFDWTGGIAATSFVPALAYFDGVTWYTGRPEARLYNGILTGAAAAHRLITLPVLPGTWAIVIVEMDAGSSPTLTIRVSVS